jgi:hypothetical protein
MPKPTNVGVFPEADIRVGGGLTWVINGDANHDHSAGKRAK